MKPKFVYHGGGRPLEGVELNPVLARDLYDEPDNTLNAVYATDIRDSAIKMGLLSCKGVRVSSLHAEGNDPNPDAIIYDGWPNQEYFYLFTLSAETFEDRPKGGHQWVSFVSVAPISVEKLAVAEYVQLVRKSTVEEKKAFFTQFKNKLHPRLLERFAEEIK